jgi:hypothetical protein
MSMSKKVVVPIVFLLFSVVCTGHELTDETSKQAEFMKKVELLYDEIYSSSGIAENVVREESPCNYFVCIALERLFKVKDFTKINTLRQVRYLTAKEILQFVQTENLAGGNWKMTDSNGAIVWANLLHPVIAVSAKHVALVIPSGNNEVKVVTMYQYDPGNGKSTYRCMPCAASKSFSGGPSPSYYYRKTL